MSKNETRVKMALQMKEPAAPAELNAGLLGLTKVDLDELLRFEVQRAQDALQLWEQRQSANPDNKLRRQYQLREEWRRRHEDFTLERCQPELLAQYSPTELQSLKQHVKVACVNREKEQSHLTDFLCLHCWPNLNSTETTTEGILALVHTNRLFISNLLELQEDLGPKPGQIWTQRWRHRVERSRRQNSAQMIQIYVRGYLARKRFQQHKAGACIVRFWKGFLYRKSILKRLYTQGHARALQRWWRFAHKKGLWKRSSTLGIVLESKYAVDGLVRIQSFVRCWVARREVKYRRWVADKKRDARIAREWRATRQGLIGKLSRDGVLEQIAESELTLVREVLEIEALKLAEQQTCEQQILAYEKRVTHHLKRAKLPPGWVLSEDDMSEESREQQSKSKTGARYLCLKTGQVVDRHPNYTKLDDLKLKARKTADQALEKRVNELDHLTHAMRAQHELFVRQMLSNAS
mmetsp:Transcript_11394/g.22300  ORF Transcript_11394/g.22300 Transcript_11394/m.22300 type:complete len:464 (+) Transcript_11394:81-1472(+)